MDPVALHGAALSAAAALVALAALRHRPGALRSRAARDGSRAFHACVAALGVGAMPLALWLWPLGGDEEEEEVSAHAAWGRAAVWACAAQATVGALKLQRLAGPRGGVRSLGVHDAAGALVLGLLAAAVASALTRSAAWVGGAAAAGVLLLWARPAAAPGPPAGADEEPPPPLDLGDRKLRVVILTVGTRGDVQPFVALGVELQSRGHTVAVATTRDFRKFVESYGLEFHDVGLEKVQQPDCWLTATDIGEMMRESLKTFLPGYAAMCTEMYEGCKGADLIVATAMTVSIGLDVSEKLGVPCWATKLAPDIPTGDYAPVGFSTSRFRWLNTLKHYAYWLKVAGAANDAKLSDVENQWRKDVLGLGPIGVKRMSEMAHLPSLCAFSDVLVPKPRDWPTWANMTGFWLLDGHADFEPPRHVADFLAAGEPPVCVNFGSMVLVSKGQLISDVIAAATQCGHRVLLITGWADPPADLPESVCCVREYPHELIFPQCLCVVHHGGAGTVARVLGAGVPNVVVPILKWADQPMYAERLRDLGVGEHVSEPSPPVPALMEAIDRATTADARRRAREAAQRVAAEGGVAAAVDLLSTCICGAIAAPGQEMSANEREMTAAHCVVCS